MMPSGTPIATYRVQLNGTFGFDQAAAIADHLGELGISHFYASPLTKARAGSMHGYDVVDYGALNPELGDAPAFRGFVGALTRADLGLILDFVPNHMGVNHADNAWWLDVLEWGPQSLHAASFDIDWNAPGAGRRVLLPILGTSYGEALERGAIKLRYDAQEGSFSAWYYEHRLPIAPSHYPKIVRTVIDGARAADSPKGGWLLAAAANFENEGAPTRETLRRFRSAVAEIGAADVIARGLAAFAPAGPGSPELVNLHCLLERQHYRLVHWRRAATDINYRRFFDISSLAGLRVEDPGTFAAVHRLVGDLITRGDLQGLRIDHVDGLHDPAGYFENLQTLIRARQPAGGFYVVMEKILERDEPAPQFAGVAGTTGYEWLNVISRLLLDGQGLAALDRIWRDVSGEERGFEEILLESKRHVLEHILASEFTALVRLLRRIAAGHYGTRDYSAAQLRRALMLFVLHFPVYRTYVTAAGASPMDRRLIEQAIAQARAQWTSADDRLFDFLREALTLDLIGRSPRRHSVARVRRFAAKVQQLTGPMMAKSLEDTAFYRDHRLIALNEVGGDPDAGALAVAQFHELMRRRNSSAPHGLTATATHDTKRGEDARARLLCLSEMTAEWAQAVATWRKLNEQFIDGAQAQRAPSPAHEYMLYQALLGAWPAVGVDPTLSERLQAFAIKAAREGKQQTSWLDPNEGYEAGLRHFVSGILDPAQSAAFLESFGAFARRVALMGALNSLTQLTLKCTMPGVPDFYQGTEFWDLSLVDPDNRRPVDFEARSTSLRQLVKPDWPALARQWPDGRIKLALTCRLLALRGRFAQIFAEGDYRPLEVEGRDRDEIVAFARCRGEEALVVIVARLFGRCTHHGLRWPHSDWDAVVRMRGLVPRRNLLLERPLRSGPACPVAELLDGLPVAILEAGAAGPQI